MNLLPLMIENEIVKNKHSNEYELYFYLLITFDLLEVDLTLSFSHHL